MDTNAKVYKMKSTILTILISLSFLFSRSQEKVNNQFEKQVLKYFGVNYSVNKKKQPAIAGQGELPYPDIFSNNLIYVNECILKSRRKIYNGIIYLNFNQYFYKNRVAADLIMKQLFSLDVELFQKREYGPLSKDYNLFFVANNTVIHFVAVCDVPQNEWDKIKDKLLIIAKKNYKVVGKELDKLCGL